MIEDIIKQIREIPDFPSKGILFRDITPALLDPNTFRMISEEMTKKYREMQFDKIAGIESRGFFFASVLALSLGKGLIPLRKPGKLPWNTVSEDYSLEYGTSSLEMHVDAVSAGEKVLIVDDLLATGGTAAAAARLIEKQGGEVAELFFVLELTGLKGSEQLGGRPYSSLIEFK
ncbi:MAG: adenine phosphoribosyltransferase [Candidatus Krumholzibacteria bacterium]|nr:adenine phosphoribosyltransferase [Candidatus Krumholzibacteria bacterium]